MSTLHLHVNKMLTIDVSVHEGNPHTDDVWVKFERTYEPGTSMRCDEMFITPLQLKLMGEFLIKQAKEIEQARFIKETDK